MGKRSTDTLVSAELRWKPVVLAVFAACAAASVALGAQGLSNGPLAVLCLVACAALVASNVVHLVADGTTFGMIPVSVVSLGFAAAAAKNVPVAVVGLGVGALLLVGFALLRAAYRRHPALGEKATLVVLGCAVENGRPSKTLEQRLARALSILKARPATVAIVTGGPVAGTTLTEADVMAQWLVEQGVEQTRVILERQARNTDENLEFSARLVRELGLPEPVCVVSSDYHLWRARNAAATLTPPLSIVPVAAQTPPISRLQQWSREVLVAIKTLLLR